MTSDTTTTFALPEVSDGLSARLADGLDRVNAVIVARVEHDDPFIAEANRHLIGGGKRLRPLLALLTAQLGPLGVTEEVVAAAAAVELTHLASLYHDDVMDDSDVRHGQPTVHAAYGNSTAILVGDLLFGTASEIMSELGTEAVKIQAKTFVRLCAGQIRDDRPAPESVDPVDYYLGVLADKTGVLIATAARYGAMFSGAAPAVVEVVREYGECLGMAFQLADDLLDVASDASGKTPGTDLREGKRTLPVLFALASRDPADARLQALLRSDLREDEAALAEALQLLRAHPAMQQAADRTRAVGRGAQDVLAALPDSEARNALMALATSVVERTR